MAESLYNDTDEPSSETFESATTLGTIIKSSVPGRITHLAWRCPATKPLNEAAFPFILYDLATQNVLARVVKNGLTADARNVVAIDPVTISANQLLISAVFSQGQYGYTANGLLVARTVGHLTAIASGDDSIGNGRYNSGSEAFPNSHFSPTNFYNDVVFEELVSGPSFKIWNGSAEVAATVSLWDGTAEVPVSFSSIV